ncbi:MAG: acyl-CoA thioesterase domain-containing protein [Ktedonobacterales bacterium]
MNESLSRQVGAVATLTKELSEADLALFLLVMGDGQLAAEEPPNPERQVRQQAPGALLAALLTAAAARHAARPQFAHVLSASIRFVEPAYTDDQLIATAELVAIDATTQALHVTAHCENQDGRRLAEGEFDLSDG